MISAKKGQWGMKWCPMSGCVAWRAYTVQWWGARHINGRGSGTRSWIGGKLLPRIPQWGHLLTAQLWVYGSVLRGTAQWRRNCLGCIWTWASSLMPMKNKWVKIKIRALFFFNPRRKQKLGLRLWAGPSLFISPQLLTSGTTSMCMFPQFPHIPGKSNPKPQKEISDTCFPLCSHCMLCLGFTVQAVTLTFAFLSRHIHMDLFCLGSGI